MCLMSIVGSKETRNTFINTIPIQNNNRNSSGITTSTYKKTPVAKFVL